MYQDEQMTFCVVIREHDHAILEPLFVNHFKAHCKGWLTLDFRQNQMLA